MKTLTILCITNTTLARFSIFFENLMCHFCKEGGNNVYWPEFIASLILFMYFSVSWLICF